MDKKIVKFTVPGKAVGKQRPRFSRTYTGVRTYTPRKTQEYEDLVRISYRAVSKQKLEGAISATIYGYFEPPKSISKKQREQMLKGDISYIKKIDSDNLAKSILDALNGVAYDDDAQVCLLIVQKLYAETARVEVVLEEIGE
nr:MAG TPA: Endodeoxyribonuclease RusA [Caudoviricetes sp.]